MCRIRWIPSFLFLLFPVVANASGISYEVEFEGVEDHKTLKEMKLASHLTTLKKRLPTSINALRYRADSDIPSLVKVLQAHGYYEGRVSIQIHEILDHVTVVVKVNPGPCYQLSSCDIHLDCPSSEEENLCCPLSLEDAGIRLNKPMRADTIIQGELKILQRLSECGFPLAKIEGRNVTVDGKTKQVHVVINVKTVEHIDFGPTTLEGNTTVKSRFIERKIAWIQGEGYDSRLVEKTQSSLIGTGLFSSVLITHEQLPSQGEIPLKIEVNETKHQSVNLGVSYQTVFGPGITFGWEHKNIAGMGRTLGFQGDITRISQTGTATYLHPDFNCVGQTMVAQAEAAHEDIYAYSMRSYSLLDRFERTLSSKLRGSLGVEGDRLYVTGSAHNGNYWLVEVPFYLRWSTTTNLLDPLKGVTLEYTVTPAFNSADANNVYLTQLFQASFYKSIDTASKLVVAQKASVGSICSNGIDAIPLCNRFLGGTEEELRGYRYKSVSPLQERKPLGGRSALYYTFELRLRATEILGLVPFFDIGRVGPTAYPKWEGKWYKSTGLGLRFFTFMGPFRVDVAFPLNPRKDIDPHYKILASIGQTF